MIQLKGNAMVRMPGQEPSRRGLAWAIVATAVATSAGLGCSSASSSGVDGGTSGTGGTTLPTATGGSTASGGRGMAGIETGGATILGGYTGSGGTNGAVGPTGSGGSTGRDGTGGTGGATEMGGATEVLGGAMGTGGTTGVGGASGLGGATDTGGTTSAGGATGSAGGVTGLGGATGTGGTTESGGAMGTGGSTVVCSSSSACIDFTDILQEIDGFGASSAGHGVLGTAELDAAFRNDTNGQLGLSILRVEIDVAGQTAWGTEKSNATNAKARGAKYVLATPWSPPASMKTNTNTVGGELSTSSYGDYAAYLKSYAQYMGSDVDVISVQNEPNVRVDYVSCNWSPTQLLDFTKSNAQDVGVPIMMPETFNYDTSYSDPVLNDSVAVSHVSYIGLHLYGAQIKAYTLAAQKQKKVWMTEHFYDPDDIGTMMSMAKEVMDCLNNQMNGYIWWYLRLPSCNLVTSTGAITNKGYVMGQFSKYVRPGSHRVNATYQPQNNVNVQAFAGANEKNVIIALNRNTSATTQTFTIKSGSFTNAHKYTTSSSKKLADDGPVTVTNNSFAASLDARSVTTFVAEGTP